MPHLQDDAQPRHMTLAAQRRQEDVEAWQMSPEVPGQLEQHRPSLGRRRRARTSRRRRGSADPFSFRTLSSRAVRQEREAVGHSSFAKKGYCIVESLRESPSKVGVADIRPQGLRGLVGLRLSAAGAARGHTGRCFAIVLTSFKLASSFS